MDRGKKTPLISVIIPHYGGEKILQECLTSLESSNYSNLENLVLDNNSSDDSIRFLEENYSKIRIIKNDGKIESWKAKINDLLR